MSAFLNASSNWSFRIFDKRLIVIKTKNESIRKIAVQDTLTNLSFAVEVPENIPIENLQIDKEYLADLRVYTSKDLKDVQADYISFFEAVDIDQSMDDFIKAYWVYPSKIQFRLDRIEEP